MRDAQSKQVAMAHARRMAHPEPQRPRVLLADDDPEVRGMLAAVLRQDGMDVIEARDGIELLELIADEILAEREKPGIDLVVSDIRMPGRTGLNALANLRRDDWATPVLLITAFGDRQTDQEADRLGAIGVFHKPFDLDDFRTAVLNVVGPVARREPSGHGAYAS